MGGTFNMRNAHLADGQRPQMRNQRRHLIHHFSTVEHIAKHFDRLFVIAGMVLIDGNGAQHAAQLPLGR